jgi:hypothetical protein
MSLSEDDVKADVLKYRLGVSQRRGSRKWAFLRPQINRTIFCIYGLEKLMLLNAHTKKSTESMHPYENPNDRDINFVSKDYNLYILNWTC